MSGRSQEDGESLSLQGLKFVKSLRSLLTRLHDEATEREQACQTVKEIVGTLRFPR